MLQKALTSSFIPLFMPPTTLPFIAASLLFASLFLASADVAFAESKARTHSVSGNVTFAAKGGSAFLPLNAGQELAAGSRVRTGVESSAVIVVLSGAAIELSPETEITISELVARQASRDAKQRALISIKGGTAGALIDPKRAHETDFKFQTPNGVAAARGTFYAVSVRDGKTYVGVKKGKVGVAMSKWN